MCVNTMDKEFQELIEEYDDCPEELFKLAKTPFEKGVVVEFFKTHEKIEGIKKDISWCKWLIISVFGLTGLGVLSQWFPVIIKILTGA